MIKCSQSPICTARQIRPANQNLALREPIMSKSIYNISGGALALNAGTACTTAVPAGAECDPAETAGAGCHLAEAAAGPACAPCGFRVSVGYATAAAEEISGDTAISSGLSDGSLALILSDGMGKGIRAAALSRAATSRLRKNLKGGMAPAHAIKEVNTFMVSHAKAENFATLDLLIIDRNTRKAKFYKMGAASSFVLRDGKVRMFEQAALPIGIIPEIRLTHVALQLRPGDIVLMVSDGITEAGRDLPASGFGTNTQVEAAAESGTEAGAAVEAGAAMDSAIDDDIDGGIDGTWLRELLEKRAPTELAGISARKLARWILAETVKQYGERERDDLTVAAIKILPA